MANIRQCRQCGKMVDFDEPWCDHETMEESAWLDIQSRQQTAAVEIVIDGLVEQAAVELGFQAGKDFAEKTRAALDKRIA